MMRRSSGTRIAARLPAVLALAVLAAHQPPALAQGEDWPRHAAPEDAGFSSPRLAELESYWDGLDDAAVSSLFVVYKGAVLVDWGDSTYGFWCHSMRKSLLSALYGRPVEKGTIDLQKTMADLGIDDLQPLTPTEKQARVIDLLKARSGVYIEAACESQSMKDARPERGSHAPGTFWYYNNWDFNVLGTIFRQETGRDIFREFDRRIARPIGMQDFEPAACEYYYQMALSMHPCYTFRMSPRDRARFGQLFLQLGLWNDRQVVSEAWIEESTRTYSATGTPGYGYGYMWWTYGPPFFRLAFGDRRLHDLSAIAAHGFGGQVIFILPDAEMVIVTSVDVPAGGDLTGEEILPLIEGLLTARPIVDLSIASSRARPTELSPGDGLRLTARIKNRGSSGSVSTTVKVYLSATADLEGDLHLIADGRLDPLAARRKRTLRLNGPVAEDLSPGTYYVVVTADQEKANWDLSRANNVHVGRRKIVVR